MIDNKTMVIIGVAVIAIAVVLYLVFKKEKTVKEGFLAGLPTMVGVTNPTLINSQGQVSGMHMNTAQMENTLSSLQNNSNAVPKGSFFSNPAFQSILAPRAASVNYGSNIRHNMPATENQGIPCNPLTFGKMATVPGQSCGSNSKESYRGQRAPSKTVKEGYSCGGGCGSGCTPASCNTDGTAYQYHSGAPLMQGDYTAGNYASVLENAQKDGEFVDTSSMLPITTMTSIDDAGQQQPVQFTQMITTSLLKGRGQGQGDKIRGDIAPVASLSPSGQWFVPHQVASPVSFLQQGALNVITDGLDSNVLNMAQLLGQTSTISNMAGASINTGLDNMSMVTQKATSLGMHQSDINVTGFP